MNPAVVGALVLRYVFLYTRTPVRLIELVFWPAMELLVWGFLTLYLQRGAGEGFPHILGFLIGAMILWDILFRAQQGVSISFLEDVWTSNLLNIFVAPIRKREYLAATFGVGFLRIAVTIVCISVLAFVFYQFDIRVLHWYLLPFFANLMLFGWSLGMIATALILRWGQAAEALAWAVPFMVQPIAAVYYPVDVLPPWLQKVAFFLPCSHVFEGMREVVATGHLSLSKLGWAFGLNFAFMALAATIYAGIFRYVQRHGLLTKVVSH